MEKSEKLEFEMKADEDVKRYSSYMEKYSEENGYKMIQKKSHIA